MTENSLTTLYCIIDDFIHRFLETSAGKKNLALNYGRRGPKRRMPIADVVTLNLVRIFDRIGDLKTFHKNIREHYVSYFPALTNYENFLKAANKATGFIIAFVQYQLYLNSLNCTENVFYVDSTPVSVCENRYISSHNVMKGLASRGKSTKGWFFGFKLQGICTANGTVVRLCFRPGKEHDSQSFADITEGLEGTFVTDAGYLLKEAELKKMFDSGRKTCTATRKNMNRMLTKEQFKMLMQRNRIENVWSVMKLNYNLIYHRARSATGMFRHFFYSISGFCFILLPMYRSISYRFTHLLQNSNFDLIILYASVNA